MCLFMIGLQVEWLTLPTVEVHWLFFFSLSEGRGFEDICAPPRKCNFDKNGSATRYGKNKSWPRYLTTNDAKIKNRNVYDIGSRNSVVQKYSRWPYIVPVCVTKICPHCTGNPHYIKTGHHRGVYIVPNDFTRTISDTRTI